jgi:hypothetical protein
VSFAADGDGTTLVYSRRDPGFSGGGATFRVTGSGERVRLPGVPPTRKISAAEGRIALALSGGGTVQLRDAQSGALLSSITLTGNAQRLALGSSRAAVLVNDGGDRRIEWYDLAGTILGHVDVRDDATDLDMAGPRVVYRNGRRVHVLDIRTQERPIVARPRATPVGLSIERRRVAWAMNVAGEGIVKRVIVPAG